MEQNETCAKKTINYYMRVLHRDIGFFTIGLVIIYSLSGILLIYRDVDFLKCSTTVEKKLPPNLEPSELGRAFHSRDFKVIKTEGETVYFQNGTYNMTTGVAVYTSQENPFPLNKFIQLHKASSKSPAHWFLAAFGFLLIFLAVSSFWMFKKHTPQFRRGVYITVAGIIFSVVLLLVVR